MLFTRGMREKMSKKIASYFLHLSDSMLVKARELIESTLCTVIYWTAKRYRPLVNGRRACMVLPLLLRD